MKKEFTPFELYYFLRDSRIKVKVKSNKWLPFNEKKNYAFVRYGNNHLLFSRVKNTTNEYIWGYAFEKDRIYTIID